MWWLSPIDIEEILRCTKVVEQCKPALFCSNWNSKESCYRCVHSFIIPLKAIFLRNFHWFGFWTVSMESVASYSNAKISKWLFISLYSSLVFSVADIYSDIMVQSSCGNCSWISILTKSTVIIFLNNIHHLAVTFSVNIRFSIPKLWKPRVKTTNFP